MSKAKSFFNALSGISGRHNKALREVNDWAELVEKLLGEYDLYSGSDPKVMLGEAGAAKVDLTEIAYKGRLLLKTAADIKGQDSAALMAEIIDSAESVRRYMIKPGLQNENLINGISKLREAYEKLSDTLAQTDFM